LLEDKLVTKDYDNFPWRIFISLNVPYIIQKQLSEFKNLVPKNYYHLFKWVDLSLIHCTLTFLGNCMENQVIILRKIIEDFQFENEIDTYIESLDFFPNKNHPKIFIAKLKKNSLISQLYDDVSLKLLENNFESEISFLPHITIARKRKNSSRKELSSFISILQKIEYPKKVPFQFNKISLIRSILKSEGPEYKVLAESSMRKI
jgi:2'-5' RNA ligase